MLRTLFWAAAVIVSAAVAYVLTVPGTRDSMTRETATTLDGEPETIVVEGDDPPAPDDDAAEEAEAEDEDEDEDESDAARERARLAVREAPLLPDLPADPLAETPREILAPDDDELAEAPDSPPPEVELAAIELGNLPFDAECGLRLRRSGESDVVFASGISLDSDTGGPAAMHIDGELVPLRRVTTDGEPIGYSQYGRQLYEDESGAVIVAMTIDLDDEELLDSARISDGAITVMKAERATLRLEVDGRVGC